MKLYIQAFVTVLSLINPSVCGLIVMATGMQFGLEGLSAYIRGAGG